MKVTINPKDSIQKAIAVPPSKSYAQRALALAGLANDNIVIQNLGENDDVRAALSIIQELGAEIIEDKNSVIVYRSIDFENTDKITINCGESGLSTRLFSAFSLLFPQEFEVVGEGSIQNRPMDMVEEGLKQFGKHVESNHGKLPLKITGFPTKISVEIDGSVSSQFISGLLLVAPFLSTDTEIRITNPTSTPYISMTLELLRKFGLEFKQTGFTYFYVEGNQQVPRPVDYIVEGDWSSATFWMVAGVLGGEVKISGLKKFSKQADRAIIHAFENAGIKIEWEREVPIVRQSEIQPFEFDATDCPDLFPPLVVLAAHAKGKSIIKGANRLLHKESNRAYTLQEECAKIGVKIELEGDNMIINGGTVKVEEGTVFSSHNDHRIAMAMSLFSIHSFYPIEIEGAEAVSKSYPEFFKEFQ